MYKSNSEYLVRNQVQAANQQNLVEHGVERIMCQSCSVYRASVPSVLSKVCSMYCTRGAVCIIKIVQCELPLHFHEKYENIIKI